MGATVNDILSALEAVAPAHLAEEWDNVGLQIGSRHWPVQRVFTALDPTIDVIREVQRREGDVLVTHHPLLFRPLPRLDLDTPVGMLLQELLAARIAVLSAHTNLDSVRGGVNDILAAALRLEQVAVLQASPRDERCGLGRVGRLPAPVQLADLAAAVKSRMGLPGLRFAGDPQLSVVRMALCSGSGASLLDAFFDSDAQVYLTGDVRYHDAREVEARHRGVIDIGHFESEHIVLENLSAALAEQMALRGWDVAVEACLTEQTPFRTV